MTEYQECLEWVDVDSCDPSLAINTSQNACTDVIAPHRHGYCLCHDGGIRFWGACQHDAFSCSTMCAEATMGCASADQIAHVYSAGQVVACVGAWSEPGLLSAENMLCDVHNDFEICSSAEQTEKLGLDSYDCAHTAAANTFYATKIGSDNLIAGCGDVAAFDALPVRRNNNVRPFSLAIEKELLAASRGSWRMYGHGDSSSAMDGVLKTSVVGGGVLCCAITDLDEVVYISVAQILLELIVFVMLFAFFTLCVIKSMALCCSLCSRRRSCFCCGCAMCARCCPDGIIRVCGCRIPTSCAACVHLRAMRDIEKIQCKAFAKFGGDEISENSAHCVICLDDYAAADKVIKLKCSHHFHRECGQKWLVEHQECPICRQCFKTAKDQRINAMKDVENLEMKDIEMNSNAVRARVAQSQQSGNGPGPILERRQQMA